jgi:AraC family transcriptional regulator
MWNMEWSERMNSAINYIEENLAEDIDIEEAAKRACCSPFHFQRIFWVVAGITLAEYVRRRRLTLAASDLSSGKNRVIDVAMKYGYDSPDAFTRAFRNVHGVTPLAARGPGVSLVAYPRITFSVILKGGINMDYRIFEKPAFDVVAKTKQFSTDNDENFKTIPLFWDEFNKSESPAVLSKFTEGKLGTVTEGGCLGICLDASGQKEFTYAIGVEKPMGKTAPVEFEVIHVPSANWAVFESIGPMPKAMQDVLVRIFQEWFPSTGYEHDAKPELEVYFQGNNQSSNYHSQVWIPIIKKRKK